MKKITLTQGKFAIVDDDVFDYLNQFKWYALKIHNNFYAVRQIWFDGKSKMILMHREILGLKYRDGISSDHHNHNGLDNHRSNLRICTNTENQRNSIIQKNNTCGFKGVSWHKKAQKWIAKIGFNGRQIHLGSFNSKIKAAQAYDRAAKELFGEFACLNFPGE